MIILKGAWHFLTSKPNIMSTIIVASIAALGAIWGATQISNQNINSNINSLKVEFNQKIEQTQSQSVTINSSPKQEVIGIAQNNSKTTSERFSTADWIMSDGQAINNEGFYCPRNPAFPSWFMWSVNKHPATYNVQLTFSLLDKTDNNKNPTLFLSYGDKTGDAPDSYYKLNLFDGDPNTIRLYDRGSQPIYTDRSLHEIPLNNFITLTLTPTFSSNISSILNLNPVIYYKKLSKETPFEPEKDFKVDLPFSAGNNSEFQFGLGVSNGDCFKVTSSNL